MPFFLAFLSKIEQQKEYMDQKPIFVKTIKNLMVFYAVQEGRVDVACRSATAALFRSEAYRRNCDAGPKNVTARAFNNGLGWLWDGLFDDIWIYIWWL